MRSVLLALALLVGFAAPSRGAETQVTILTASTTGIYYPLGMALSSIFGNAIKGVGFSVQATQGSVENRRLLEAGDGELGFLSADSLANAVSSKDAGGERLRGVAALYPAYVQLVANKESGIKTLADLKGKRVSVGPEGAAVAHEAADLLKAAGLTFGDLARVDYAGYAEGGRMVVEGALDADFVGTGGLGFGLGRVVN